jgi:Double-stranded RNA binding motif
MANPKGELIAYTQRENLDKPQFKTHITGPDHEPTFHCDVVLGEKMIGQGQGPNKKVAEKRASEVALLFLTQPKEALAATSSDFEGPYPIFESVLAESLRIAQARVDAKLMGAEAITQIQTLSLQLYKHVLLNLGDVIEE